MGLPVKIISDLALVLVPKLFRSKEEIKKIPEKAKKAATDLPSNTVAIATGSAGLAGLSGAYTLPDNLEPYSLYIHIGLLIVAAIYAKHFKDENE